MRATFDGWSTRLADAVVSAAIVAIVLCSVALFVRGSAAWLPDALSAFALTLPATALLVAVALAISYGAGWLLAFAMRSSVRIVRVTAWIIIVTLRCIPFFCLALYTVWLAAERLNIDFSSSLPVTFVVAALLLACFPTPRLAEALARAPVGFTRRDAHGRAVAWIAASLPSVVAAAIIAEMFLGMPGQARVWQYGPRADTIVMIAIDAVIFLGIRAALHPWMPSPPAGHDESPAFRKGAIAVGYVGAIALVAVIVASLSLREAIFHIDLANWRGTPLPPCFLNATACGGHVLGTDEVGRDLAARLIVGLRNTLLLGLWTLFLEAALLALAFEATRRHATLRYWISRVADSVATLLPWPAVAMAALLAPISLFGESFLVPVMAALIFCAGRLSAVLASAPHPARTLNLALIDFRRAIVLLTTIDFFGYGVIPLHPSLGNILGNAQALYQTGPWVILFPVVVLVAVSLAIDIARRFAIGPNSPEIHSHPAQAKASA